jgi:hypothetical protein
VRGHQTSLGGPQRAVPDISQRDDLSSANACHDWQPEHRSSSDGDRSRLVEPEAVNDVERSALVLATDSQDGSGQSPRESVGGSDGRMQREDTAPDGLFAGREMHRVNMQIDNLSQPFREQSNRWGLDRRPTGDARYQHRDLQELPHNAYQMVVRKTLSRHFTFDSRDDCHVTVEKQ